MCGCASSVWDSSECVKCELQEPYLGDLISSIPCCMKHPRFADVYFHVDGETDTKGFLRRQPYTTFRQAFINFCKDELLHVKVIPISLR